MAGTTSEILAKLGIDVKDVPKDLQEADKFFKQFSKDLAKDGGKTGESYGGKLVDGIGKKFAGAAALGGALGAALGINIEKIAESITSAIVGGSKAGFEEMERLADKTAENIARRQAVGKGPADAVDSKTKELKTAIQQLQALQGKQTLVRHGIETQMESGPQSEEEKIEAARLVEKITSLEADIAEKKNEQVDAEKQLAKSAEDRLAKEHTYFQDLEEEKKLKEEIAALMLKGANEEHSFKTQLDVQEKENQLAAAQARMKLNQVDVQKALDEAKKEALTDQERMNSLAEKEYQLRKGIADQSAKLDDKAKLTIGELANLKGKGTGGLDLSTSISTSFGGGEDNSGLSADQLAARDKARRIQELQGKAESARTSGDAPGAGKLLDQIATLQTELVKSGSVKSTEAPEDAITEAIAHSNELLTDVKTAIDDLAKKHFANE